MRAHDTLISIFCRRDRFAGVRVAFPPFLLTLFTAFRVGVESTWKVDLVAGSGAAVGAKASNFMREKMLHVLIISQSGARIIHDAISDRTPSRRA